MEMRTPVIQRARGRMAIEVAARDGGTVLRRLRQEGCLKARLPRPERGAWTTAVTLNSSGGVAQGDVLATEIDARQGARLTVAAQAAERFYRAPAEGRASARVATRLRVGAGAALEWLPQETILFDGSNARRVLAVELDESAWFLGVETVVFGRARMGETVERASWRDVIEVRRAGRLVLHDATRLEGPVRPVLAQAAVADGGRAVATLVHVAPGAAVRVDGLRAALDGFDAGVSVFDGVVVARMVASDGACARRAVVAGLSAIRDDRPLPRVWSC